MNLQRTLALALDPARILQAQGLEPDPWQRDLLLSRDRQVLLNCSRQSGKSTVVAALALHTALFTPAGLVLLLSPSLRQSFEIFRKVIHAWQALGQPLAAARASQTRLELAHGARVVCLPGREETVRSFSGVNLLVLDEAARIPDQLYHSVRPMLAVSRGRLVALSTPFGRQGWFYHAWQGPGPWKKVAIAAEDCPRISPAFIAEEERAMGRNWVDQEYRCLFTALEGLVYPDFARCLVDDWGTPTGRPVGGIDFGWRNPFAAIWGVHDRDDVLWIGAERYAREVPLHEHITHLKQFRGVEWTADPAGATEISECRVADLKVWKGFNDIRLGIAAVTARLRTGRLKVRRSACPNLISESQLYRYPTPDERAVRGENPVDAHNHALAALRYLVTRLDQRFIARLRKRPEDGPPEDTASLLEHMHQSAPPASRPRPWLRLDNEFLWE